MYRFLLRSIKLHTQILAVLIANNMRRSRRIDGLDFSSFSHGKSRFFAILSVPTSRLAFSNDGFNDFKTFTTPNRFPAPPRSRPPCRFLGAKLFSRINNPPECLASCYGRFGPEYIIAGAITTPYRNSLHAIL